MGTTGLKNWDCEKLCWRTRQITLVISTRYPSKLSD